MLLGALAAVHARLLRLWHLPTGSAHRVVIGACLISDAGFAAARITCQHCSGLGWAPTARGAWRNGSVLRAAGAAKGGFAYACVRSAT